MSLKCDIYGRILVGHDIYIIPMLKNIFAKHFNAFNGFIEKSDNFIKLSSLHWAGAVYKSLYFFYMFFVCWFVCLLEYLTWCYCYCYILLHVLFLWKWTFLSFCILTLLWFLKFLEIIILYIHDIYLILMF